MTGSHSRLGISDRESRTTGVIRAYDTGGGSGGLGGFRPPIFDRTHARGCFAQPLTPASPPPRRSYFCSAASVYINLHVWLSSLFKTNIRWPGGSCGCITGNKAVGSRECISYLKEHQMARWKLRVYYWNEGS